MSTDIWQIDIHIEQDPVSIQSSRARKVQFAAAMKEATQEFSFTIIDDIAVSIELVTQEEKRYESDRGADIDNIIKPLIDSLTGPNQLLVDDCIVQSVYCGWLGHNDCRDYLKIRISAVSGRPLSEISINRRSLVFLEVDANLFLPMDDALPIEFRKHQLSLYERAFALRKETLLLTGDYYLAQLSLPQKRLFHKSRITSFPMFTIPEYQQQLKLQAEP